MRQKCKHLACPLLGWLLFAAGLLCCTTAVAQRKITGKITDTKTGKPIDGASIREKGASAGVASDASGSYSLTLKSDNAIIIISSVGYTSQEIKTAGRTSFNIVLTESEANSLDDVVMVGYQNTTRRKTSAAISTVRGKDIENTPYPSFDAMLQGRVAGLTVLSTSGEPGANNIVNIRGTTSLTENGVSSPLYVIDGIVFDVTDMPSTYGNSNPLTAINPNDIESIDVLKDASASAIYGARAANGVILVKTKRPRSGKPQFRVSAYAGISDKPALKPVIVGAETKAALSGFCCG